MKNIVPLLTISAAITACNNNGKGSTSATTAEADQATQMATATLSPVPELNRNYSWADFKLQGKVKELTEYSYLGSEEENDEDSVEVGPTSNTPIRVILFNPQGFVTQVTEYEEDKAGPYEQYNYQYDSQNRLILIRGTNSRGKSVGTEKYDYTPEGILTGYTYWENSDSEPLIKETYETISTPEGKKVIEKGMDGKPNEIKYYNAQNLLVKRTYYDNNAQKPTGEATYTYDANNRCQKETYRDGMGSLYVRVMYSEGTVSCQYDEYGNLTKVIVEEVPDDDPSAIERYEYGKKYTYDQQGNIIHAIINMTGQPIIRKYEIKYY